MAENLAFDEALLNEADRAAIKTDRNPVEVLRFWESPRIAVVVGRGTRVSKEIDTDACKADNVSIYRRCSGGTSVVVGPGCLMYALLISYETKPHLKKVDEAHQYVMGQMQTALQSLALHDDGAGAKASAGIEFRGACDLTLGDRKFSGNALRCRKHYFLYHGTFLYDFALDRIPRYLGTPPRQPDYRHDRDHAEFVVNLPAQRNEIQQAVRQQWGATETLETWSLAAVRELVQQRYSLDTWHTGR